MKQITSIKEFLRLKQKHIIYAKLPGGNFRISEYCNKPEEHKKLSWSAIDSLIQRIDAGLYCVDYERGFYWVEYIKGSDPTIATYNGHDMWYILGDNCAYGLKDIHKILEKLTYE